MWMVKGGAGFLLVKLKSEAQAYKTEWWLTPVIIAFRTLRQEETGEVEPSLVQIHPKLQVKDLPKTKASKHHTTPPTQSKQKPKARTKRKSVVYVYVRTGLVRCTMLAPTSSIRGAFLGAPLRTAPGAPALSVSWCLPGLLFRLDRNQVSYFGIQGG